MKRLEDKVAVVTGGSKGIGRAIAQSLAEEGVHCMLAARTAQDLSATADEISSSTGVRAEIAAGDLRTEEGCRALHDATMNTFGRIDILVNSAGATKAGPFLDLDDENWKCFVNSTYDRDTNEWSLKKVEWKQLIKD